MSLSAMKNKIVLYYKHIKLAHHVKNVNDLLNGVDESIEIAKEIFEFENNSIVPKIEENNVNCKTVINQNLGKKQAENDCNKDYPATVEENIQIFKEYLKLLKEYNIKPIVVVFPASECYTKYFSKRIQDEFYEIINKTKKEYFFQYIDYFKSKLFDDNDFRDVSHLNEKGAEKFTKILNEIIE
jgi:lysophospholipase L1-like esterase